MLQLENVRRGGGPPYEHATTRLFAAGAFGGSRGADGALVCTTAPAAPSKPPIPSPPCSHYLRLQILRSGADTCQARRHNVSLQSIGEILCFHKCGYVVDQAIWERERERDYRLLLLHPQTLSRSTFITAWFIIKAIKKNWRLYLYAKNVLRVSCA